MTFAKSQEPSVAQAHDERLHVLIADYLDREAAGQAPNHAAWLAEHAEFEDELRQFLEEHERLGRVGKPLRDLAQPAGADAVTVGGASANTTESPAMARSFGDYELLTEIARGGMGVVYKARQKSLDRLVALKMILAGQLATDTDVQRFKTEAAAAGQLDHPNIVPVYDIGDHEGQHYFSMKLIEGDNLARAIAADRWQRTSREGQEAIAQLIARTARAVHYAHQRGILHRDVKPGNILLDDRGQPHVTDFGLAKRVGGESSLTHTGAVVGTPAYMPPEQASGSKQLSVAADVYSLGGILYEMLTGRPPFVGDSALSILSQVCADEPAAPRKLNANLDPDLATICLRCLEKEPARRYASAEALADDLDRWLGGEPIEARPSTAWERTLKWAKRRPAVAALVGVSVASAAALIIVGVLFDAQLGFALQKVNKQQQDLEEAGAQIDQARLDVAREQADTKAANGRAKELLADATSLRLAARSEVTRSSDPALALLLAIESAKAAPRRGLDQNNALAASIDACREIGPLLRTDIGYNVSMVRWFADGRRVLSVDYHTVRIWDAKSAKELVKFAGPHLRIHSAALSPDDRWLALTFEEHYEHGVVEIAGKMERKPFVVTDEAVRVYDTTTGAEVQVLRGHKHRVMSVAFSADGERLVTASWDRTARMWERKSGKTLHILEAHECALASADFTADGRVFTFSAGFKADLKRPRHQYVVDRLKLPPEAIDPPLPTPFRTMSGGASTSGSGGSGRGESLFACLWDAATGAKLKELRTERRFGELAAPLTGALSPDGRHLLATLHAGAVVWDVETGKELHAFKVQEESARSWRPQFSADGKRALVVFFRTVRVWDVDSGKEIAVLRGHTDTITTARFTPDAAGAHVLTTSLDRTLRLWDAATGGERFVLRGHEQGLTDAAFHVGSQRVVSGSNDGTLRLWNVASHTFGRILDQEASAWWVGPERVNLYNLKKPKKAVWSAAFSPEGQRVAAGYFDGVFRLWDVPSEKFIAERRGYESFPKLQDRIAREIFSISFSHDGKRVVAVAGDAIARLQTKPGEPQAAKSTGLPYRPVRIYDGQSGAEIAALEGLTESVRLARFSPDGEKVLTAAGDRNYTVTVNTLGLTGGSGTAGGADRSTRLFDARTGKQLHVFFDNWKEIYNACWDAKGERICTVHESFVFGEHRDEDVPAIRVWDIRTGHPTHKLMEKRNNVNSAAFSPDGRRLLTWYDSRIRHSSSRSGTAEARVWDLASGKILFSLKGTHDAANFCAYSPDGRFIVTTAYAYNQSTSSAALGLHGRLRDNNNFDRTARLWDAETGALVRVLHGHNQSVHDAAFSKDGKWLVTCSEDKTARIWEVATGKEWITLRGHDDDVKTAQFSPDGQTVLTTSWDGTARLWPVDPLPMALARKPRELTDEERERFEVKKD